MIVCTFPGLTLAILIMIINHSFWIGFNYWDELLFIPAFLGIYPYPITMNAYTNFD